MLTFLLLIFSPLFIYLSWRNLTYALALVCAFLPSYLIRFQVWFLPTTALELMILILFVVWLVKVILKREKIQFEGWSWLLILFLTAAAIAVFVSQNRTDGLGIWKAYFVEPILFFIIFINTIKEKKELNLIFYALGFSAFCLSLFAIYQKFTGFAVPYSFWQTGETHRVTGLFEYPNALGLYLAPIAILFAGLAIKEFVKKPTRNTCVFVFLCFCVFVNIVAIYFAKSEGALIAFISALIFLGLAYPNRKTKIITLILIILAILSILFIPQGKSYAIEKLTLSDLSGQIRKQQWKETWQMLSSGRNKIIFGAGLANYQKAVEPYHQKGIWVKNNDSDWLRKVLFNEEYRKKAWQPVEIYLYPHNIVLNFWSETGIIGLIAFCLIVVKFFWLGFKNIRNKIAIALISAMAVILIHGLVDVAYFKNDLAVFFWLLTGMMVVVARLPKQKTLNF